MAWVPTNWSPLPNLWRDSDRLDDGTLAVVLEAAEDQCRDFLVRNGRPAPSTDAAEDDVPSRYRLAVIYQARALHRSLVASNSDQIGADGIATVTVYPMDRTVQRMLVPMGQVHLG